MKTKAIIATIAVSVAGAVLFEFVVKPKIQKVLSK